MPPNDDDDEEGGGTASLKIILFISSPHATVTHPHICKRKLRRQSMASYTAPVSRPRPTLLPGGKNPSSAPSALPGFTLVSLKKPNFPSMDSSSGGKAAKPMVILSAKSKRAAEKKRQPGEAKGFVEEMRFVSMRLHTRDQTKEGEKKPDTQTIGKWEPTVDGYLRFLVDSKVIYDALESIVEKAAYPWYSELRNIGLERSDKLAKDLEWFKEQGYVIPKPSLLGTSYAQYLEELSDQDPQAFICHFYNIYVAHTAGGRKIGKKVAEKILDNKELEFYKWEDDLSQLLQNVTEKLNKVASVNPKLSFRS